MLTFSQHQVAVYLCPHCDQMSSNPIRNDDYLTCRYCDQDLSDVKSTYRDPKYVTVAVYSMYQTYGGPEEGGWYYWEYDLIPGTQRSFLAEDAPQADVYMQTLITRWSTEEDRRWPSSERFAVCVLTEADAPAHEPKRRPRYC